MLNSTKLPDDVPVRLIRSVQSQEDLTEQDYRRRQMGDVMSGLGGMQQPFVICWNCTRDFPVANPKWTADKIAAIVEESFEFSGSSDGAS